MGNIKATILKVPFFNKIIFNNFFFKAAKRYLYVFVQNKKQKQWNDVEKLPMFFEHDIDLYSWYNEAEVNGSSFLDRGVISRLHLFKGAKVLDLCSGDGFYPYHFYCDLAEIVDCVDFSEDALTYAKNNYALPNLNYHRLDLKADPLPKSDYDVVIWNAGLDYFNQSEQLSIVNKIIAASKKEMVLVGMVPKTLEKEQDDNHAYSFENESDLKNKLMTFFNLVEIKTIEGKIRTSFYFTCSQPK